MLTDERKAYLLAILSKTRRIVAKDISRELQVSEDTIRRDLRQLAGQGQLKRVHGGAVPLSPAIANFSDRQQIGNQDKSVIGKCAASMIEDGQSVFIDGGTTALQLARQISTNLSATIITHSPAIAMALMQHDRITVEIIGGRLFRHSIVTTGAATIAWLERYRPDLCFIGATGIHPEQGITTGDSEEAEVKRQVIERSGASYILASMEKLGAVSSFKIASCRDVDGIIATSAITDTMKKALQAQELDIILSD